MTIWRQFAVGILLILPASPASVFAHPPENNQQISIEKSGAIATKQGLCLRLNADPGNVRIFTDEFAQVSYRVVIEADSRDSGAESFVRQFTLSARQIPSGVSLKAHLPGRTFHGQFGVSFEIHVPRRYNLKINTQGGNIEVQDIEGQIELVTGGGNITVGRVSAEGAAPHSGPTHSGYIAAQLETQGGHITIGDVAGTLHATTSGGHIMTGNIDGDGILRTGGGQIQTGRIAGVATLETGGGNIHVMKSGSSVTADTAGGQIDFAEVAGAIRTRTGGGAVHINRVTGPAMVETSGGGIFLGRIDAPLRVSSGEGDIIAHLPRQLAATIDAVVERDNGHTIVADPLFSLRISYQNSESGLHTIRGEGSLNGGGEALHLTANSGNIILKLGESRATWNDAFHAIGMVSESEPTVMQEWNSDEDAAGFLEELRQRIQKSWWGGVPVDAGEMQDHLEYSVAPAYPEVASSAGVEGDVALRVYVSGDGRVTSIRVLDGPPILARAAVEAVRQWQYQAPLMNGRPVSVVTTLVVAFRLK